MGLLREYRDVIHALKEAASARASAPLTRGRRNVVQARLVTTSNASEDIPLASLKDDLERKKSLRSVMPGDEAEGYPDERWRNVMGHPGGDPALEGQLAKPDANYRYGEDSESRCENCTYFDGKSGCSQVAGLIRKIDTCDLFEPGRAREAMRIFERNMRKYPR